MQTMTNYDIILVNTSAGKDSQAMLDYVCTLADAAGVRDRVVAVHCDLGRVEWAGTRELAEKQCAHYNVPLHVVSRPQGDLLDQIESRGKFPGPATRFCTSDHKRSQVYRVLTKIVREFQAVHGKRQVRILNCIGLRAEESSARSKLNAFEHDAKASNGKRHIDTWLPIHTWKEADVWACIKASGAPYHRAYDLGMPRLSCVFCIYAPKAALLLAGEHNPELLAEYVRVEQKIGHSFKFNAPIADIQAALANGERASREDLKSWVM